MKAPRSSSSRRKFIGSMSLGAAALSLASRGRAAEPRKLGVALVGLGGYSTGQLGPALKLTKNCRLAGVVTGSREKGLKWAQEFGFPESSIYNYDTMARIGDNKDIDIIYVVTPNALHAQHTIAAAWTGKHVICEKPMANNVADCDAMIRACRVAGVKLAIGYRLHFEPQHQEMMRLARDPGFGPLTKMNGGLAFPINRRVWRVEKAMAGGGPLMDIGIYCMQAACMAADTKGDAHPTFAPVAVTAREHPKKRPEFFVDVEETIEWTMEFANGAKADLITSYNMGMDRFRAESDKGNWIEFQPGFGYGGFKVATNKGPLGITPPQSQQALQLDGLAECFRDNKPIPVPGEMGRRDMVIMWVPGHWRWSEGAYVWEAGRWEIPPAVGVAWTQPEWQQQGAGYVLREGYWAEPAPQPAQVVVAPSSQPTGITQVVYADAPPPPPQREVIYERPSGGHVWVPGYWTWRGGRHVWVAGYWIVPPRSNVVWVPARWETRGGRYAFVEGYWRDSGVVVATPPPAPPQQVVVASPQPQQVLVVTAPPPVRQEVVYARPSPRHVWVPGYWAWNNGRYVWMAGHYMLPPRGHDRWVEPRWERRGNSYVFVEGHWR